MCVLSSWLQMKEKISISHYSLDKAVVKKGAALFEAKAVNVTEK